jgi:hypothetical protein
MLKVPHVVHMFTFVNARKTFGVPSVYNRGPIVTRAHAPRQGGCFFKDCPAAAWKSGDSSPGPSLPLSAAIHLNVPNNSYDRLHL